MLSLVLLRNKQDEVNESEFKKKEIAVIIYKILKIIMGVKD